MRACMKPTTPIWPRASASRIISNSLSNHEYKSVRIQGAIARLMEERKQKLNKIIRQGDSEGRVTVLADEDLEAASPAREFE